MTRQSLLVRCKPSPEYPSPKSLHAVVALIFLLSLRLFFREVGRRFSPQYSALDSDKFVKLVAPLDHWGRLLSRVFRSPKIRVQGVLETSQTERVD